MRVRILRDFRGPIDRLRNGRLRLYTKGDVHLLSDDVAEYLIHQGLAEDAGVTFSDAVGASTERKIVDAGTYAAGGGSSPAAPASADDLPKNGAWYTLPNGEKVLGRAAAQAALDEMT